MTEQCHICGTSVVTNGVSPAEASAGFTCADCGEQTCSDCKSIGVARSTDHCKRCRG